MSESNSIARIIYVILKNRYFIVKNILIFSIFSSIILLLFFPNWYKGTTQIILPESQGLSFTSLITTLPFKDVLAPNFSGNQLDNIAGIIESRTVKQNDNRQNGCYGSS